MNRGRLLVFLGSMLLIAGAFLPWISVTHLYGSSHANEGIAIGWEGDGVLTAAIGILLIVGELFAGGEVRRWHTLSGAVLAALAAAVVLLDMRRILEIAPKAGFFAATDIGLYVTLAGSLLAFAGCFWGRGPREAFENKIVGALE